MQEIPVFFIRGLSTKGQDHIQFAFLKWGTMHGHFARELGQRGITVYPVIGMGSGMFDELADSAVKFLRSHPAWESAGESSPKVHLMGHSAGGLIGKRILSRLTPDEVKKVGSLVTIATPHGGSALAEACLNAPARHPIFTWLLNLFGFDVRKGAPFYRQLTPATQFQEFGKWQAPAGVKTACIVSAAHWRVKSWPFLIALLMKTMREIPAPHDGLLEVKSQTFGQVLGHYELDHLTQLGVYGKKDFYRMCDRLAEFYHREN